MRKFLSLSLLLLGLTACSVSGIEFTNDIDIPTCIYASLEDASTKTFIDSDLKLHWNAGDEISVFSTTANQQFKFTGESGDREGSFILQNNHGAGNTIPALYAVYPYNEGTTVSSDGTISLTLPYSQHYAECSFGPKDNTMVAVDASMSSDELVFKNICGYIVVKLYGQGVVKAVSLSSNSGERISGQATVTASPGSEPIVSLPNTSYNLIHLDCGDGIALNKSPESAIEFWFAVPPVTFATGFTVSVFNPNNEKVVKATSIERTVTRNTRYSLAPFEVRFEEIPAGNVQFESDAFKEYCVTNFDADGDGEVSFAEATVVSMINVNTDNISSLQGLEHFTGLQYLLCMGSFDHWDNEAGLRRGNGKLTTLDVSGLKNLLSLACDYNQLETLILGEKTQLLSLSCSANNLTSLDLSPCPSLTTASCAWNLIEDLNVKNHPSLVSLSCSNNKLTTLDASGIPTLSTLTCSDNILTSLVIDNDTSLSTLLCEHNKLGSLSLNTNTHMEILRCGYNDLSSLNLAGNKALGVFDCSYNHIDKLNLGNNTNLTVVGCYYNGMKELIVNNLPNLAQLYCNYNELDALNLEGDTSLKNLSCQYNNLTSLNLSGLSALESVDCQQNLLTNFIISGCTSIWSLDFSYNNITAISLTDNTELTMLNCPYNKIELLDVSNNLKLNILVCHANPNLTEIWLRKDQVIENFTYDSSTATVKYKD